MLEGPYGSVLSVARMNLDQVVAELRIRNLPIGGRKNDLFDRLK